MELITWWQIHRSTTEQTNEAEEIEDRERWELPAAGFTFPKMPLRNRCFCALTLEIKAERIRMGSKFSFSSSLFVFSFLPLFICPNYNDDLL